MADLNYSEAHHRFRERLRTVLEEEVVPHMDQWDNKMRIPRQIWRRLGQEGFLCMSVPPEFGGQGLDFLYSVITIEELTRIKCPSLFIHLHSDIVVPYIEAYGRNAQKRKYLPGCVSGDIITAVAMTEPAAGSDLASMETTAVKDGNEIILNGSKTFISNGINCHLVIVAARNPEEENPHQAISLYLVEDGTPGFKRGRQLEKMGLHSQDTAELFFTNCRIHQDNILGRQGSGFLMLMEKLQQERLVCAVGAICAAEFIFEYTLNYYRKKKDLLGKYQVAHFALAEMATQVKMGRIFVNDLVARHVVGDHVVLETCMAKYWTSDAAKEIGDRCMDLLGDFGMQDNCPVSKAYKDIRVMPIFAGTNEIMKGIISQSLGL